MKKQTGILRIHKKSSADNGIEGAGQDIIIAGVVSTIPVQGLASALPMIIYLNRVEHLISTSNFGDSNITDDSNVYYVNYDATRLTIVASWASSVALLLPGFTMTLFWYHLANSLQRDSRMARIPKLPTPYQFGLLLALRSGGLQPLWEWILYLFSRRRARQTQILSSTGGVLMLAIALGFAVWAADTWLHITTTTVNLPQMSSSPMPTKSYGRQLPWECGFRDPQGEFRCTTNSNATQGASGNYLRNPLELYQVLTNQSTNNQVLTVSVDRKIWSYLAPARLESDIDFKTTTIASHSDCRIATKDCGSRSLGSTNFNCSVEFSAKHAVGSSGESNRNSITLGLFADAQWTIELDQFHGSNSMNPFFTIAELSMNSIQPPTSKPFDITYGLLQDGGFIYFMACETELANITYTMMSGSITAAEISHIINPMLITALVEPTRDRYYNAQILDGALRSLFQNSTSSLLETYAARYDTTFLASAATVIEAIPNLVEQSRTTILVTRVAKAPLFALVAMLILTALLGTVMTLMALHSSPRRSRNVQARLSILGLTSARFQDTSIVATRVKRIEDLFGEHTNPKAASRLGMLQTEEGEWKYTIWKPAERRDIDHSENDSIPLISTGESSAYLSLPTSCDGVSLKETVDGAADRISIQYANT